MGDMTILLSCGCVCKYFYMILNGYFDRDKNDFFYPMDLGGTRSKKAMFCSMGISGS